MAPGGGTAPGGTPGGTPCGTIGATGGGWAPGMAMGCCWFGMFGGKAPGPGVIEAFGGSAAPGLSKKKPSLFDPAQLFPPYL